jgi:CheY-like chemotaxis protein
MERQSTLMLVEDERILRGLVAQFLRTSGFRVLEAADGREAVDLYERQGPFDLVVLDLNLPELDGVEVCRRIRRERRDQPILVCSASILPEHLESLGEQGVDRFLTKPFHPASLLDHVQRALVPPDSMPGWAPTAASA